jgi:hypothetical protein
MAGARNGLPTLGVFGHLALTAPDVSTAIEDVIGFLSVFDRVASARLTIEGDTAAVNYLFDFPSAPGADQFTDGAMATISRMAEGNLRRGLESAASSASAPAADERAALPRAVCR